MKKRKWSVLLVTAMTALCMGSCSEDWGKMDPGAGNQVFPKLAKLETFKFDKELDPTIVQTFAYDGGEVAGIAKDDEHGDVLHMNGGYARVANPAAAASIQKAVGLTFWMKQPAEDLEGALFSFQSEDGTSKLSFSADGQLNFTSPAGSYDANGMSDILPAGEWHFVAVSIGNEEYVVSVDGEEKFREAYSPAARAEEGEGTIGDAILEFAATAPYLYLGYGNDVQTQELMLDDVTAYRNEITAKETAVPELNAGDNKNWIILGNEDNSTGWWTVFSDTYKLKAGETLKLGFYNYTLGGENWHNWAIICLNNDNGEHFVMRADAWAWFTMAGGNIGENTANVDFKMTSDYDWNTFKTEMNGAWVDLTVTRTETNVTVNAVTTTADGVTRNCKFEYNAELEEELGFKLTMEKAHLKIDPASVCYGKVYEPGTYIVGNKDFTSPFWNAFTETYPVSGKTITFDFINNTTGAGQNYHNWVLVCAKGDPGSGEYFALRPDAYGWFAHLGGNTNDNSANLNFKLTHNYDFNTFVQDMCGARCIIQISHSGTTLEMRAKQFKADGSAIPEYTFTFGNTDGDECVFFTVEAAYLDIRSVGTFPYFDDIK